MKFLLFFGLLMFLAACGSGEHTCCDALNASCEACNANQTLEEYCELRPETPGCDPDIPPSATKCIDRPRTCADIYRPVCGSDKRTHGNSCYACADSDVGWHTPGECGSSCADTVCALGETCEVHNGQPVCIRTGFVECRGARPELCTQEYDPVCATVDTGVRCVAAPCDGATGQKTYGNACSACADKNVYGYVVGEC